jgi:hypothetical protein
MSAIKRSVSHFPTGLEYVEFFASQRKRVSSAIASGFLLAVLGCTDGPFYELKKLNPVIQDQWKKDRARRPVYHQRVEEFQLLRTAIAKYPVEEQRRYIELLANTAKVETSPDIRRHIVLVLSEVLERPDAMMVVTEMSKDKESKVRLEVAKALRNSSDPIATQALLALAASDKSDVVRNMATESLGNHKTEDVKSFLAKQLDSKQPGAQYAAYLALKEQTGKSFGGDAAKMRAYLLGEPVDEDAPSFLASPIDFFLGR